MCSPCPLSAFRYVAAAAHIAAARFYIADPANKSAPPSRRFDSFPIFPRAEYCHVHSVQHRKRCRHRHDQPARAQERLHGRDALRVQRSPRKNRARRRRARRDHHLRGRQLLLRHGRDRNGHQRRGRCALPPATTASHGTRDPEAGQARHRRRERRGSRRRHEPRARLRPDYRRRERAFRAGVQERRPGAGCRLGLLPVASDRSGACEGSGVLRPLGKADERCTRPGVQGRADADVLSAAQALAQEYASSASMALGFAKRMFEVAATTNLEQFLDYEMQAQAVLSQSYDHKEGTSSFKEKRKPEFKGR
ncbi:conserved hypothetical protein [Ricinus communis]|uniref:Enoyl-CoA hydratase n=1 Tax=Ricinus communis TaxID=3988 RepID=B9TB27_RICCO|nr:conserved hypothetical protein [Ricinus communis]